MFKKYLLLLILLIASKNIFPQNCTIILGAGTECTGFNICSINTEQEQEDKQQIKAEISLKAKKIQIAFFKKKWLIVIL